MQCNQGNRSEYLPTKDNLMGNLILLEQEQPKNGKQSIISSLNFNFCTRGTVVKLFQVQPWWSIEEVSSSTELTEASLLRALSPENGSHC